MKLSVIVVLLCILVCIVIGREVDDELRLPTVYGNWCGPGGDDTRAAKPIDAIDTCCMKHDLCYSSNGFLDCSCDREIIQCLNALSTRKMSWKQKFAKYSFTKVFQARLLICSKNDEEDE